MTEEGYDEVKGVPSTRRVVEQQIRDQVTDFHLDNISMLKHLEAGIWKMVSWLSKKKMLNKKHKTL